MSNWNVTQDVNFYPTDPPLYSYSNGTGVVAPVALQSNPLGGFDVETLQITYIIKSEYVPF
jgi:hypothetical protein